MPFFLFLCLMFCSSMALADWKENCQSHYEPIDVTAILPAVIQAHGLSARPDAKVLEDRLRQTLLTHAQQSPPAWNATEVQDLGREVQEFLFQQKPDAAIDALRSHWALLLLAQHQWDVLAPALKNQKGPWTLWQQAETRLGRNEYAEALPLFASIQTDSLQSWVALRLMETRFLAGQIESALDTIPAVLDAPLATQKNVREGLGSFFQAFSSQGHGVRKLIALLQKKQDEDAIGQVASCVLKNSHDADDRGAALAAVLDFKRPHSQSLRLVSQQIENQRVEPAYPEGLLNWLQALARHANLRFADDSSQQKSQDAFIFVEAVRKMGEFLLQNPTLTESPPLLARLDESLQMAFAALPKNFDPIELKKLRARVLEKSQRYGDAAGVWKELALASRSPQDQRRYADQMLKNFAYAITPSPDPAGRGSSEQVNDETFVDACRIYQRLVPDGRQELSRCDLMMARKAMGDGQTGDARQKLWQIVYAYPEAVEGQTAAERLIELSRADADELYMATDKLLNIRNFQSGPWGNKLKDLRRQSSYQRIAALASTDDKAEAYFFFSQKEKGDPLASKSLLSAVQIDQQSGRLARAMDRLETWLQDYPTAPEAPARILDLVTMAEKALQIKRARQYIQWAESRSWTRQQNDFIQQKTCLFDTLENPLLAVKTCEKIGNHVTQGVPLRLRLARALAYSGYSDPLNAYARDQLIPRSDFSVDDRMEVLDLLRKTESLSPARRDDVKTAMTNAYLEQTDSLGPHSRRILGGLAYQAAQKSLPAFLMLPVHGSRSDEWVSSVQAKKQAFDELEALYNKVLQTKDPHWGSSALCDLALAAENFAENLNRLPEIEGLDRKKIFSQMASQVAAWRAKAKSFAGSASKTIEKFGTLHRDNRRIIQEAHRLKEDTIQFNDWIPSLLEAEPSSSQSSAWTRWEEVAADLLEESSRPENQGTPTALTMIRALDFSMLNRDFARVEWLNDRLLQSKDPKFQSLGYWNKGRLLARLDDFDSAEDNWQKALRLDPENRDLQKQLGLLYARFGFFAKALNQLRTLEQDPQVAITLVAMERQLDRDEQADHRCESLTQPPSATPEALFNCSLLEFQNHRNASKAIQWMDEALRQAPVNLAEDAKKQLSLMQAWKARFQADR